jgi:hypothetical protein
MENPPPPQQEQAVTYIDTPIPKKLAEAALAAIKAQFAKYLDPIDLGDGGAQLARPVQPELVERFDDRPHWAIVWRDGPTDWVVAAFAGGRDDDAYQLLLAAGTKRDNAKQLAAIASVPLPDGVFAEAIRDGVLGLYPEVKVQL